MDLKNFKLILASGSPRRKDMFEKAGLEFELRKNEVEETYPEDLALQDIAEYLANQYGVDFGSWREISPRNFMIFKSPLCINSNFFVITHIF